MTISAVSIHHGGTLDVALPLVKRLHAVLAKHGVQYRLSQFDTGPNTWNWLTIVTYRDRAAYDEAQQNFAQDAEYQEIVSEIRKFATQQSRELVTDIDL